jgi:hypothetical protein
MFSTAPGWHRRPFLFTVVTHRFCLLVSPGAIGPLPGSGRKKWNVASCRGFAPPFFPASFDGFTCDSLIPPALAGEINPSIVTDNTHTDIPVRHISHPPIAYSLLCSLRKKAVKSGLASGRSQTKYPFAPRPRLTEAERLGYPWGAKQRISCAASPEWGMNLKNGLYRLQWAGDLQRLTRADANWSLPRNQSARYSKRTTPFRGMNATAAGGLLMKIDFRTARVAILVCCSAAISPIDFGWSQTHCDVQASPSTGGLLLNGEPATAAQIRECEQCAGAAAATSPACVRK